jgi:hypothetical protein
MEIYSAPEINAETGVHKFGDTGDAYDFCQCSDDINTGDLLVIEREGDEYHDAEHVVGLAWAWPIAVTAAPGKLHSVNPADGEAPADTVSKLLIDMADSNAANAVRIVEQARKAIAYAVERGWPLCPCFDAWTIAGKQEA